MSTVTTCPCCDSLVRVEEDETLGIVRIAKPRPGDEWRPRKVARRTPPPLPMEPVPLDVATSVDDEAREVIERVAGEHGFTLGVLRSPSRSPRLVRARWAAMAAARSETDASLPQIGRILNRDHTTVLHGLRRMEASA
jgi:hypothetical protein